MTHICRSDLLLLLLSLTIANAGWTGPAVLKLLTLHLCETGWFQQLCNEKPDFCFNIVRDSNILSSLTSSDPHRWKVQRTALQTHRHWTDTTWWVVIGSESDLALVMFWPIRAPLWALSRASVFKLSSQGWIFGVSYWYSLCGTLCVNTLITWYGFTINLSMSMLLGTKNAARNQLSICFLFFTT